MSAPRAAMAGVLDAALDAVALADPIYRAEADGPEGGDPEVDPGARTAAVSALRRAAEALAGGTLEEALASAAAAGFLAPTEALRRLADAAGRYARDPGAPGAEEVCLEALGRARTLAGDPRGPDRVAQLFRALVG